MEETHVSDEVLAPAKKYIDEWLKDAEARLASVLATYLTEQNKQAAKTNESLATLLETMQNSNDKLRLLHTLTVLRK